MQGDGNGTGNVTPLRAVPGSESTREADWFAAVCREIDMALNPIIGAKGVAALYKRSVHVASLTHPWLLGARGHDPSTVDFAVLTTLLANRPNGEAAAGGALILETLHALLTTLIGLSLAERLLRPAWTLFLSGPPTQEPRP